MTQSIEDVVAELGKIAAEIDELAREWHQVDEESDGPALLAHWRTRIVLAAMKLDGGRSERV